MIWRSGSCLKNSQKLCGIAVKVLLAGEFRTDGTVLIHAEGGDALGVGIGVGVERVGDDGKIHPAAAFCMKPTLPSVCSTAPRTLPGAGHFFCPKPTG